MYILPFSLCVLQGRCVCVYVCVCVCVCVWWDGGERDMTVNEFNRIKTQPPNLTVKIHNASYSCTHMNESMRSPFGFSRTMYRPHSLPSNSSASSRCINPWYSVLYSEGCVSSCVWGVCTCWNRCMCVYVHSSHHTWYTYLPG